MIAWGKNARLAMRATGAAAYASGVLGVYELQRPHVSAETDEAMRERYKRHVCRTLMRVLGVRYRIDAVPLGAQSETRGRLVVANHRSALDIGILLGHFGGHILSRGDVAGWPLVGRLADRAGTIFVDRKSRRSGARAIREIRRHLEAGRTVTVFPEGTTFLGDEVRPFQSGAFAAARGLNVEVIPVGFAYEHGTEYYRCSFGTHLSRVAQRKRTQVVGCVGAPLESSSFRDTAQLAEAAREAVQRMVDRARPQLEKALGASPESS